MTDNWDDNDGAWDDDEFCAEDAASCPECGEPVEAVADKCPACGYWLSDADRSAMWSSMSKPLWLRVVAVVTLAAFVLSLLAAVASVF